MDVKPLDMHRIQISLSIVELSCRYMKGLGVGTLERKASIQIVGESSGTHTVVLRLFIQPGFIAY